MQGGEGLSPKGSHHVKPDRKVCQSTTVSLDITSKQAKRAGKTDRAHPPQESLLFIARPRFNARRCSATPSLGADGTANEGPINKALLKNLSDDRT